MEGRRSLFYLGGNNGAPGVLVCLISKCVDGVIETGCGRAIVTFDAFMMISNSVPHPRIHLEGVARALVANRRVGGLISGGSLRLSGVGIGTHTLAYGMAV